MSFRSLIHLLKTSGSNYDLHFASLYRLTSKRRYSTEASTSTETQASNIEPQSSAKESITNESSSTNTEKRSSFANRRKVNRDEVKNQQNSVPLPSSMLRTWEKSEKRLPLNSWNPNPSMRSYQNVFVSKLPVSATRRDIETLTRGIFSDDEKPINKIFMIYNHHYKPTGTAWIQFNHSRNALLFTKYVDKKIFYGNKLNVELMKYIPDEVQMDPLNYRAECIIILAGLPLNIDGHSLAEYIRGISGDKNFKVVNVTRNAATPSDTSKWLLLSNNVDDSYHIFSKIHNTKLDSLHKIKARVVQ